MKLRKGCRIRSWDALSVVPFSAEAFIGMGLPLACRRPPAQISPAAPRQRNRSAGVLRFTGISPAPTQGRPSLGGAMTHQGRHRQFVENKGLPPAPKP
ncbi:MAG: hypothetical protein RLZZ326_313 [Planctomycetota bacterium]